MSDKRNAFGGKNPHGLYVPLTDDELEVIARLACAGEFKIIVRGWGYVEHFLPGRYNPQTWTGSPIITFGDKRASFYFMMHFNAPAVPQPNYYFDMEVWAKGHKLFSQRMPTEVGGNPIQIVSGMSLALALDVALDQIDPAIVKEIKPGAIGLTTRHGNMHLDTDHQKLLHLMRSGEQQVRIESQIEAAKVTDKMKRETR